MRFDKSFREIDAMEPGREKAVQLAVSGLLEDGGHHKQWYLEQILVALGEDPGKIREELLPDYDWEDGIAP